LLPALEQNLSHIDKQRISPLPAMRFFQWSNEMDLVVTDIIDEINKNDYKMIRCFSTNTLESQTWSKQFSDYGNKLLQFLHTKKISVELYMGNWINLLEQMIKTYDASMLSDLPAWQASLMIFIIWEVVYIILFKTQPVAIKIESKELSSVIWFLLKQV
jgi:hypothetical protein